MMLAVVAITSTSPTWCQSHTVRIGDSTFLIHYDTALLIAKSVEWFLSSNDIGKQKRNSSWRFVPDHRYPGKQPTHEDYSHSGYDRGHMLPAADRSRSISSMKQTFVMTNVCPQVPALNRGEWKRIEEATRKYAAGGHRLWVQAFPIFWQADTQRIGINHVPVPHGFVKTVRLAESDSIIYTRYFQNY